ncbi:MAG TPA: hypothetical protein PLX89_20515 [Verrucomicrobiota bacterium]|nr:hypothetical protein [Verrucomicrobiales bacterium]HRI15386.1 hypothetical protein [Verrucomicrobiota bacterium]
MKNFEMNRKVHEEAGGLSDEKIDEVIAELDDFAGNAAKSLSYDNQQKARIRARIDLAKGTPEHIKKSNKDRQRRRPRGAHDDLAF